MPSSARSLRQSVTLSAGVAAELRTQAGHLAGAAAGTRQAKLARVMGAIAAKLS